MAKSSNIIGAINFVAMLLSIPVIGAGIWLSMKPDNDCLMLLQWPVIITGILILIVAIAGFVGGLWRIQWLLIFYLVAMLILIMLLAGMVVFTYMVTNSGSGHPVQSRAYSEYRLDDYSGWLRGRVQSSFKWDQIRKCLSSKSMCAELNQYYRFAQDFFNAHITSLQSGCCKPPSGCGFTFVNPTYWISPTNTAADMDCLLWSTNQTQLCYTCDSCKAGLLANLKKEWRRADIVLFITVVALVSVYLFGCCAFKNATSEELFSRHKQGQT